MATNTEDYVSFETAKLLKEKRFPQNTFICHYIIDGNIHYKNFENRCGFGDYDIIAPTLAMAMKWLREVHNKHCDVGYDIDLKWFFQIIDLKETVEYDYPETKYYHAENETGFNTYEEACEAAIKYCLKELI